MESDIYEATEVAFMNGHENGRAEAEQEFYQERIDLLAEINELKQKLEVLTKDSISLEELSKISKNI